MLSSGLKVTLLRFRGRCRLKYDFRQGEIYFTDLNPTKGHEQRGSRPVLVVSNNDFNVLTRLVKVVPITTKIKDFPTHIKLPQGLKTTGQILTQQERVIDLNNRHYRYVEDCPKETLEDVLELISESY